MGGPYRGPFYVLDSLLNSNTLDTGGIVHHFFAYVSKLKYILRWGLKRNVENENVKEHSFDVATIAHGADLSATHGLRVANVFHAGDGNMHPLILFDANQPGELELAEEVGGKILELCVEAGGSITGEHGVGREKINQMCAQFQPDEITAFHAVKAAFDEHRLLNPGKNIPTLQRCAEFGAMHVHNNELPHPELPRF